VPAGARSGRTLARAQSGVECRPTGREAGGARGGRRSDHRLIQRRSRRPVVAPIAFRRTTMVALRPPPRCVAVCACRQCLNLISLQSVCQAAAPAGRSARKTEQDRCVILTFASLRRYCANLDSGRCAFRLGLAAGSKRLGSGVSRKRDGVACPTSPAVNLP
jgi:hypothetical protein